MVVQHNMQAMNANRMLGVTTGQQAKATEKLSSGFRINRAADDAAGLTISEKMRKQIRGLNQASSNAQDGVSAVQTAEGALTEVHSMLQRMNELATQAANGTNSKGDRDAIQAEIEQLTTEIDRVAETTKFNETYLLKGDGSKGTKTVNAHDAGLAGNLSDIDKDKALFTADELKVGNKVSIGGRDYTIVDSSSDEDYQSVAAYVKANGKGDKLVRDGVTYTNDGVAFKDEDGNEADLREGDTLITGGKSKTAIGGTNVTLTTPPVAQPTWADGDTVVGKDGKTYTYCSKAADNSNLTNAGFYAKTPAAADKTTAIPDYTITGGEEYTIAADGTKGKAPLTTGVNTLDSIREKIKGLADTKKVTIGSKVDNNGNLIGTEYTIGVSTKEDGTVYTADDIAAMVKEGDYVKSETEYYYALPADSNKPNEISLNEAYNMMRDELEKASNIGTDKATAAQVKNNGDGTFEITKGKAEIDNALSFGLHVGSDADMTNKINVDIDTMSAAGIGVKDINVSDETGAAATYAIDAIADAISTVSSQRSALGAIQNRLEHTIANLDNVAENTTAAESRIRDTDMAKTMVEYSKNNILAQAGQSMLAQANQSTQGVLSLLG